jgi:hypothetical protein
MILHAYRNLLNCEIGMAEAGKAQVLGLGEMERPEGTLGLFFSWSGESPGPGAIQATETTGNSGVIFQCRIQHSPALFRAHRT